MSATSAIRNPPPRDVMLSHAGKDMGLGWAFGLHEGLDQFGPLSGPLVMAFVLARIGNYKTAFAVLVVPAIATLLLPAVARITYLKPEDLETHLEHIEAAGLPPVFWIYLVGAGLVAAGFADFSLLAYHFEKSAVIPKLWVPIFYSVAMAVSGIGSLLFGRCLFSAHFGWR